MLNLKTLAAAAFAACAASGASAAVCPDTGEHDRYFTLTTEAPIGNSCYGWGDGNDQNDAAFKASILSDFGYDQFVGKIEGSEGGPVEEGPYASLLSGMASLLGGTGGNFTIDLTGWTDVLLVFKTGTGQCGEGSNKEACTPSFAAFLIEPTGVVNGSWSVNLQQGLSHVSLYGNMAAIPLPAGGVLLLTALGGLALARRRKA